jgi:nitric oxide synthase oxygenase domain/subunit
VTHSFQLAGDDVLLYRVNNCWLSAPIVLFAMQQLAHLHKVIGKCACAGMSMVDHHTLMQGFWDWQAKEQNTRGYMPGAQFFGTAVAQPPGHVSIPCALTCRHTLSHMHTHYHIHLHNTLSTRAACLAAGNWKWIIPPLAASTSPCYLGLNKMIEYTLKPALLYAPGFKQ